MITTERAMQKPFNTILSFLLTPPSHDKLNKWINGSKKINGSNLFFFDGK